MRKKEDNGEEIEEDDSISGNELADSKSAIDGKKQSGTVIDGEVVEK